MTGDSSGPVPSSGLVPSVRANDTRPGLLVLGASEIVTMAGGLRRGLGQREPALLAAGPGAAEGTHLAVVIWGQRIAAVGTLDDVRARLQADGLDPLDPLRFAQLDARGGTLTPGLIDPHTHLVFAGTREQEITLRQGGATYLEILQAGGGILSTVARTRAASREELLAHGRRWLAEMLSHGTTTVEAKSGYGLHRDTELRQLEVTGRLGEEGPLEVVRPSLVPMP
jgi:imidazolonepropionase